MSANQRLSKMSTFNSRLKDYSTQKIAAVRLAAKIRRYWNDYGIHPTIVVNETVGPDGHKLFSIRSNLKFDFTTDRIELGSIQALDERIEKENRYETVV